MSYCDFKVDLFGRRMTEVSRALAEIWRSGCGICYKGIRPVEPAGKRTRELRGRHSVGFRTVRSALLMEGEHDSITAGVV